MTRPPPPVPVDIPSDSDDNAVVVFSPSPPVLSKGSHGAPVTTNSSNSMAALSPALPLTKRRRSAASPGQMPILLLDDSPTPTRRLSCPASTPSMVAETPRSMVAETPCSIFPGSCCFMAAGATEKHACAVAASSSSPLCARKFSEVSSLISLESDDELEEARYREPVKKLLSNTSNSEPAILSGGNKGAHKEESARWVEDKKQKQQEEKRLQKEDNARQNEERKQKQKEDRKLQKEEKARLMEEKKRKRQQDKLQKEATKAQLAEMKKFEKEKRKWETGKLALKSIVAVIDSKVIESGSVGGHLLSRFADKDLRFQITTNPIEGSILWRMKVPDQIAELPSSGSEVPYVLVVHQAEEFCDLVTSELFLDHVHKVQSQYPSFTICYVINKLTSYIKKREQNQYKNPSNSSNWRCPPVEEVLCKLTTHYTKVHSRQCTDEAELAEHVVGLTSSLANCQFRKKLTWLSVHANGSIVPNDFIDKDLIKKNTWLKALIAIPKVQPRHALAIWKKYPTMRSLLNVYMDPSKTVHEKEFLLKDLRMEGLLGNEDRKLGEACSKRLYRILMAQNGRIETDDVENGADLFGV